MLDCKRKERVTECLHFEVFVIVCELLKSLFFSGESMARVADGEFRVLLSGVSGRHVLLCRVLVVL